MRVKQFVWMNNAWFSSLVRINHLLGVHTTVRTRTIRSLSLIPFFHPYSHIIIENNSEMSSVRCVARRFHACLAKGREK